MKKTTATALPSIPVKDEVDKNLWRDDDGFIAQGKGDNYKTFADTNVDDDDIDDRERRTDDIIAAYNGTIAKGYDPSAMEELYKALQNILSVLPDDLEDYPDSDLYHMVMDAQDQAKTALTNSKL